MWLCQRCRPPARAAAAIMLSLYRLQPAGQLQESLRPVRHVAVQAAELHRPAAETAAAVLLWLCRKEAAGQLQGFLAATNMLSDQMLILKRAVQAGSGLLQQVAYLPQLSTHVCDHLHSSCGPVASAWLQAE